MTEVMSVLSAELEGRYHIESEIGSGGMATVFRARDLRHDREVAIKVLRPELAAVLGAERFLNEIAITSRLDHPHILTLIDSGSAQGFLYYVLPFVRGESLRDRLRRDRQLPIDDVISITKNIGSALEYAHRQGVIHRDVKPENILIHEGEAVLADFGIALAVQEAGGVRLTQRGLSLGTPQYMSPEQAMGDRAVDARSDEYSLAAVAYEMLVGEPPHTGRTLQVIIAKLLTQRPVAIRTLRATVPVSVATAVEKALATLPADRFPTVAGFAKAITVQVAENRAGTHSRSLMRLAIPAALAAVAVVAIYMVVSENKSAATAKANPSPPVSPQPLTASASPLPPPATTTSSKTSPTGGVERALDDLAPADSARARALDARRNAVALGATVSDLARGDANLDSAEAMFRNERPTEAIKRLAIVSADWNGLVRSRRDARSQIEKVVHDYARAVSWRDPERVKKAFPGLTQPQNNRWDTFFKTVHAVTAELRVDSLYFASDSATADLKGTYAFVMPDGRSQSAPVTFTATFKHAGTRWQMTSVR